jgi:hypothetical protein
LLAAVFFRADDFFAVDFLAAGLRAAVFFRADDFFAVDFLAAAIRSSLPFPAVRRSGHQDAMRFKRRRSRSLMPPHTPYRSSRRSA